VVGIAANAFNVSIEKIPIAGLSISFDDRLFSFLLVIVLLYFFLTFTLYYAIDIKNLEVPAHQTAAESWFIESQTTFGIRYFEKLQEKMSRLTPDRYRLNLTNFSGFYANDMPTVASYKLTNAISGQELPRDENKEIYERLDNLQTKHVKQYAAAKMGNRRIARLWLSGTRLMYTARNYFFDGILPIGLGAIAIVTLLGHFDLSWMQSYMPNFKELSTKH
jgi:hypothetical protein